MTQDTYCHTQKPRKDKIPVILPMLCSLKYYTQCYLHIKCFSFLRAILFKTIPSYMRLNDANKSMYILNIIGTNI